MADTAVGPNNAKIAFRGRATRERPHSGDPQMPVVSKKQNAAMHSAAEGESTLGIPPAVGKEFTADQAPGSVKKLPERVGKKVKRLRKRGMISDRESARIMDKHGGETEIKAASR
jgi:hypothetical protein